MNETILAPPASAKKNVLMGGWLLLFITFAVIWWELINQLRAEWWLNAQYNYGLIVPVLVAYLLWKQWQTRPAALEPTSKWLAFVIIAASAALFLPIRLIAVANPDWRFLSWLLAIAVVSISLGVVYLIGGTNWLRHFAFPFLFFLVAVPWPVRIEQLVVQDLMRAVTAVNVVFLQLVGIPALQHGNVIEVGTGFIGIEEACSGVRSLQATLMISLFLGELYSFNPLRRILLVVLGAILAFFCNIVRTGILVWVGTHRGLAGIESWHDPAGLTILIVCLFALWLVSLTMLRRAEAQTTSSSTQHQAVALRFGSMPLVLVVIWFVFAEGAVQLWYRSHQTIATSHWAVDWPNSENGFKTVPIAPEAESLLQYNEGGGASWEGADGHQWLMFFFRWFPGRTAARFIKVHRPDICLPASGRTMERDNGLRMLTVNGLKMPIRSYRFEDRGAPLHVFYCYWDARSSYENAATATMEDWSFRGRVRAALQGRREIGAQILEIVVWGYEDDGEANDALVRELGRVVRVS